MARLLLCTRRRRESLCCAGPSGAEVATQDTASTDEESSDVIARKVFVSGLPLGTSEEDLLIAFSGCGKVGSDDCAADDDVVVVIGGSCGGRGGGCCRCCSSLSRSRTLAPSRARCR